MNIWSLWPSLPLQHMDIKGATTSLPIQHMYIKGATKTTHHPLPPPLTDTSIRTHDVDCCCNKVVVQVVRVVLKKTSLDGMFSFPCVFKSENRGY